MSNKLALRPFYIVNVSGGKDSLFMLKMILSNREKYPIDIVAHYELENDYPFIKSVIDYMEAECNKYCIPFVRIKPRCSWYELYRKWGYPSRNNRWCNEHYKLDCAKQLDENLKRKGYQAIHYIGYCADEEKRFSKRHNILTERYPLADEEITEDFILNWAKTVPQFNNYYLTQKRCGCMNCPLSSYLNYAYLLKYYPSEYEEMIELMKETEYKESIKLGRPFALKQANPKYNAFYTDHIVRTKYLPKLEALEAENAIRKI